MKIRAFITHKDAEQYKDCQDRFSINKNTKSVAIADGMSQSFQQKIWAEILVNTYTKNIEWVPTSVSVKELAPQWVENVKLFIQKLKETNAPPYLIIRNENALVLKKSAGATFCGIRFQGKEWSGYVLGDSCLIEIVENKVKKIFTSQHGDKFDNHPDYFDSNPLSNGKGTPLPIKGTINQSISVLMVSDPFSDFLNEKYREGNDEVFVKQLLEIKTHNEFENLVTDWRNNYNMHNDDTTLIIIEDDENTNFNFVEVDDVIKFAEREKK